MKQIGQMFGDAIRNNKEKGYPNLFVAIDLHGTIVKPNRQTSSKLTLYPHAIQCLQKLSSLPFVKLILWTASPKENILAVTKAFDDAGVHFDEINSNSLDVNRHMEYADFSGGKFYFDVLLDDKAGFEPGEDWEELLSWLYTNYP